jgi:hypothetical protein
MINIYVQKEIERETEMLLLRLMLIDKYREEYMNSSNGLYDLAVLFHEAEISTHKLMALRMVIELPGVK